MRSARLMLKCMMIVGLAGALVACGDATLLAPGGSEKPGAQRHPDETPEDGEFAGEHEDAEIGEIHTFAFDPDETDPDFEADPATNGVALRADAPFVGAKLSFVSPAPSLEYQLVFADGTEDGWRELVPEESQDERSHRGFLNASQLASEIRFRSVSPLEYLRVELFAETVETSWVDHGEIEMGEVTGREQGLATRQQELAKPGRYIPPKSVMDSARLGAFGYESAKPPCSGQMLKGTRQLGQFLVNSFGGAYQFQGYNCRSVRGSTSMSMHGTGRAVDVFIKLDRGQADNDLGDPVANYLIKNAAELGVQYFIWDKTQFNITRGASAYGGVHPHHDHLHIELTRSAANRTRTSFPPVSGASTGGGSQTPPKPAPARFNPHFADDDGSVHEAAINAIYKAGYTRGCESGARPKYCPDRVVTRAALATFFMRAFKLPHVTTDYFTDDNGSAAEAAINALAYRGITSGCAGEKKFCPNSPVTRQQLVLFLDRTLELPRTTRDYFSDDNGQAYEAAANRVAAAGIVNGCASGKLCPNDHVTRAQIASVLARASGLLPGTKKHPVKYTPYFADDDGSIHEDAINWIYEQGITGGCGKDGNRLLYCPRRDITRAEMAVMMTRAFKLPASSRDYFGDDKGSTAEAAINALAAAGITGGCAQNKFCPKDKLTLGQAAAFFVRALKLPNANKMTQAEAISALNTRNIVQRPACTSKPQSCIGPILTREHVASYFRRALSWQAAQASAAPLAYRYVRIRSVSAEPQGYNDRVDGFEVDAVFGTSGSSTFPATRVVSANGVSNPQAALGLADQTSCANAVTTVAGVGPGSSLVVELSKTLRVGDTLHVVHSDLSPMADCAPSGTAEIAVSEDLNKWRVLGTGYTSNASIPIRKP